MPARRPFLRKPPVGLDLAFVLGSALVGAALPIILDPNRAREFARPAPDAAALHRPAALPPTPLKTLERAKAIADAERLHCAYIGNVPGHPAENTYCPKCKRIVVQRGAFTIGPSTEARAVAAFPRPPSPASGSRNHAQAFSFSAFLFDSRVRGTAAVRPPLVAGAFYPADPKKLTVMVDGFLAQAKPAPVHDLVAAESLDGPANEPTAPALQPDPGPGRGGAQPSYAQEGGKSPTPV